MKKVINILFSPKTTVVLLLLLAIVMGSATFIEEKYDTYTARHLVYGSRWFELLFLLLALNFIGNITRYQMTSWKKAGGLLFHCAFLVIIAGAAITRYTGFTGSMRIREGETSNTIFSEEPYLRVMTPDGQTFERPVCLTQVGSNAFEGSIPAKAGKVDIRFRNIIRNAVDKIEENVTNGQNVIEAVIPGENGSQSVYIVSGEVKDFGQFAIAYNNTSRPDAIQITDKEGKLYIGAPFAIKRTKMPEMAMDTIAGNTQVEVKEKCLHEFSGGLFVFKKSYKNAKKTLVEGTDEMGGSGVNALGLDITIGGKKHEIQVMGGPGYLANYQDYDMDGYDLKVAYGLKEMELPFSISLQKFVLERYPGSNSPSSFTSEVTLTDKRNGTNRPTRIFMNNVLDYDGYRFFQSSYDPDEHGTILSVNHDFYGTWVSYIGYFLMAVGFVITLLSKSSRFHLLGRNIKKIRLARRAMVLAVIVLATQVSGYAQSNAVKHVSEAEANKLAHLVVQTFDGRFEPVHTLAFDVMHKIAHKSSFDVPGMGKMDAMQVYLDMVVNAEYWKNEKIIYIREKSVQNILGINGNYACFQDFFDASNTYKLKEFAEKSFRKKQSEQNTFDKEIIKVDERANIYMMTFNGSMLKIFPAQGSINNSWVAWDDSMATVPITGSLQTLNEDLQLRLFNIRSIMGLYLQEVYKGNQTGNYERADKILSYISSMQRQSAAASFLPSEQKVALEIQYNKANIFTTLMSIYSVLAVVMLVLAFAEILRTNKSRVITWMMNLCVAILICTFLYHTYGMILRWYLTGHAPWSTGYEALLLIAWGGTLAGFFYLRNSKITLAATTLLAFFVLLTATISSYDPQLTNLQPVLKSYWLVIHVATLTISYGFLGLGFVLGLINLVIYLLTNEKNRKRLTLVSSELTDINEMNLTVGLYMATVGTFLGGIWANESWGKYWGWDAKETWALVIVIVYTVIVHLRLVPKLKSEYLFNLFSVFGFSSVLMTFFGVNYYLSKGLHSYAAGDTPAFPLWAWISIFSVIGLAIAAGVKRRQLRKRMQ